jgi:RNA polymerase subunit RPABC4/transcription elongation factor Spt4
MFENYKIKKAFEAVCGQDSFWRLNDGLFNSERFISPSESGEQLLEPGNYFNVAGECIPLRCFGLQKLSVGNDGKVYVDVSDFHHDFADLFGSDGNKMELSEYVKKANELRDAILIGCDWSNHQKSTFLYCNKDMFRDKWSMGIIIYYPYISYIADRASIDGGPEYAEYLVRTVALKQAYDNFPDLVKPKIEYVHAITFKQYKDAILLYLKKLEDEFVSSVTADKTPTVYERVQQRANRLIADRNARQAKVNAGKRKAKKGTTLR